MYLYNSNIYGPKISLVSDPSEVLMLTACYKHGGVQFIKFSFLKLQTKYHKGHCYVGLMSIEVNGAFNIASELLWTELFSLEGLHQLYTPQTVQKAM